MHNTSVTQNIFGHQLHAVIHGTGQPVLCLSGFGCSNYNFELLKDTLGHFFQCVLVDNRGMGKSEGPLQEYDIIDLAREARQFMQQLGHSRYHVIGISMGGFIAQALTLEFSQEVISLSLLCTTSGAGDFIELPKITEEALIAFNQLDKRARARYGIKTTVHPSLENENPTLFDWLVDLRANNTAELQQILLQKRAVDRFLSRSWPLESINRPALIMSGEEDRFVSPQNSQKLHKIIPNSRLATFPRTDHLFFFENSKDVSQHIISFLNECHQTEPPHEYIHR